jgi:SAM-dependent methyltransferase
MSALNPDFWQKHFEQNQTPWDRGQTNPQLLKWLQSKTLKPCRIAVPGCGKGWEVATLASNGFDVTGIDYTAAAITEAKRLLNKQHLDAEIIQSDVLVYDPQKTFDAVYEQTCLCALDPNHWKNYVRQLARWTRPGGHLYALFMQVERAPAQKGIVQGPPFHCDLNGMRALFNSEYWEWPDSAPEVVTHDQGWIELAIRLQRRGPS